MDINQVPPGLLMMLYCERSAWKRVRVVNGLVVMDASRGEV